MKETAETVELYHIKAKEIGKKPIPKFKVQKTELFFYLKENGENLNV